MAGWSHDIVRYASQVESGEAASARLLESLYDSHFSKIPRDAYQRLVVGIVENSDRNFLDMQSLYQNDTEALCVALGLVAADKLIEASGPRVLERRSFFVGGERMRNKKDLGAVLEYPEESNLGVLSETFVRLGDVNHVSNYSAIPALLALAQELHSPQYQMYKGLLLTSGMTEKGAVSYIVHRLQSLPKLADRTGKGGKRLVEERHLDGTYFVENQLPILLTTVRSMPEDFELKYSTERLINEFALADSPEQPIEDHKKNPDGPPTYRKWMNDIIAYREGRFAETLLERLR